MENDAGGRLSVPDAGVGVGAAAVGMAAAGAGVLAAAAGVGATACGAAQGYNHSAVDALLRHGVLL